MIIWSEQKRGRPAERPAGRTGPLARVICALYGAVLIAAGAAIWMDVLGGGAPFVLFVKGAAVVFLLAGGMTLLERGERKLQARREGRNGDRPG